MVTIAVVMGLLAIITGQALGYPLRDPEGFLGPAWVRLPLLCLGAFIADVIPRRRGAHAREAEPVPDRGPPADP